MYGQNAAWLVVIELGFIALMLLGGFYSKQYWHHRSSAIGAFGNFLTAWYASMLLVIPAVG